MGAAASSELELTPFFPARCQSLRRCTDPGCGFSARYHTIGCVGIHSGGFKTPVNHNIEITDCVFRNSEVGVDVHTAYDVRVSGCAYLNIKEEFRLN